jgi:hypothetical protein
MNAAHRARKLEKREAGKRLWAAADSVRRIASAAAADFARQLRELEAKHGGGK